MHYENGSSENGTGLRLFVAAPLVEKTPIVRKRASWDGIFDFELDSLGGVREPTDRELRAVARWRRRSRRAS